MSEHCTQLSPRGGIPLLWGTDWCATQSEANHALRANLLFSRHNREFKAIEQGIPCALITWGIGSATQAIVYPALMLNNDTETLIATE